MKLVEAVVEPVFQPVNLVLESQAEVNLFKALLGAIRGSDVEQFGVERRLVSVVYDSLKATQRPSFQTLSLRSTVE